MTPLEIRRVATGYQSFSDITPTVASVLDAWAGEDLIPGHALCSVTAATQGVGLIVTDRDPRGWSFLFSADFLGHSLSTDLTGIRGYLLRTSETFLVKGSQILGGRRVYAFDHGGAGVCEVAITLL
jgi:hypothetical protein